MPEAKAEAALARSLVDRVTARERHHIEAITLSINGSAADAFAAVRAQAAEYPRDALPLSLALGVFGLLGSAACSCHWCANCRRALLRSPRLLGSGSPTICST